MKESMNAAVKRPQPYFGAKGTVTGRLHWDPLVYPCKNGGKSYLFRVDVLARTGNANNQQLQDFALLNAYVPAKDVPNSLFAKLHQGSMVTVWYVVQTNTYYDDDGNPASKTILRVQNLCLYNKATEQIVPNAGRANGSSSRKHFRGKVMRGRSGSPQANQAPPKAQSHQGAPFCPKAEGRFPAATPEARGSGQVYKTYKTTPPAAGRV